MPVTVIVGAQWGDEGKGKLVDFLTEKADIVARFAGGNNAGHTVIVGDNVYKFHLLPSGIISPSKLNIIGNGTVIDPYVLVHELLSMEKRGFRISPEQLAISSNAHIIFEKHIEEDKAKCGNIGTTGRGIGPCYRDKIIRHGVRMGDFVKNDSQVANLLRPFVKDTYLILNKAIEENKNIIIEGAQGCMLDIDHGTYPFVTSSNPTSGGACTGLGIGPTKINKVIGIIKAYTTRVGAGPFPTELGTEQQSKDENKEEGLTEEDKQKINEEYYQGKFLRKQGHEYGTTTGRPRRCGWFDAVVGRYSAMVNGLTGVAVTKLDVLSGLKTLKICNGYEIDGKVYPEMPCCTEMITKAKSLYIDMPGWEEDITNCKKLEELPVNCRNYLNKIEELIKTKIAFVSIGPKRSQTIIV